MQLGKNLKYLRGKKSISLRNLAKEISTPHSQIHAIEMEIISNPGIRTVIKLADFFGITLDDFVKTDLSKKEDK